MIRSALLAFRRHVKRPGAPRARFRVVCSWCGKAYRWSAIEDSHGMCVPCRDRVLAEIRTRRAQ